MTVQALLRRVEEFGAETRPAVGSGSRLGDDGSSSAEFKWRLQASRAAADILAREGLEAETANLIAALVVFSGREFPLKEVLGALPGGQMARAGSIIPATMANLGFFVAERPASAATRAPAGDLALLVMQEANGRRSSAILRDAKRNQAFLFDGISDPVPYDASTIARDASLVTFDYASANDPLSAQRRSHTGLSWMAALIGRFRRVWLMLAGISVALALVGVIFPVAISTIFREVIGLSSLETLPLLALGFILIIAADAILSRLRSNILAWVANRLEFLVNSASFEQILKLPPILSERVSPAAQAARMRSFEGIRDFLVSPTCPAAMDIALAPLYLAIVGLIDWRSTLVLAAAMLAFALVFFAGLRFARIYTSMVADEATESQRIAIETFERMQAIRDLGLQHVWAKRLAECFEREQVAQFRLHMCGATLEAVSSCVFTGAILFLMVTRATAVRENVAGGVEVLAMTILGLRCLLPFYTLCLSVLRVEQIRKSVGQINAFMQIPSEFANDKEHEREHNIRGAVSLVNIGFRAADTRPVFVALDLEVRPGEIIGIHGAAGTGKSIILKMLLGMIDVNLGAIRLDGVDIRQIPKEELRRRISYIPQQTWIFPGTIRDNLRFSNPLARDGDLTAVLDAVGLLAEVKQLPGGLDHRITTNETREYNAEFRLRMAFAQVLLTDSQLLLIDEMPNILLNQGTGDLLRRLIAEFRGTRTIIFVSHRLDFLRQADRVVELSYGGVPRIVPASHFAKGGR